MLLDPNHTLPFRTSLLLSKIMKPSDTSQVMKYSQCTVYFTLNKLSITGRRFSLFLFGVHVSLNFSVGAPLIYMPLHSNYNKHSLHYGLL